MDFQIPSGRFLCKQIFNFKMYGSDKCSLKNYAWMVEGYLLCWVCFYTCNSNTHTHIYPEWGAHAAMPTTGEENSYVQEREHKSHHVLYVPQMGANLRCDVSLCLQVFLWGTGWGALGLTGKPLNGVPVGCPISRDISLHVLLKDHIGTGRWHTGEQSHFLGRGKILPFFVLNEYRF